MIKVDKDELTVSGAKHDLLAELTIIMLSFVREGVADVDDLAHAVAIATYEKQKEDERKDKFRESFINKLFE